MDVFRTMDVIGSGLTAERTRLNALSSNVANANSPQAADGKGPYKRKDVVLESIPMESEFSEELDAVQNPDTEVRVVEVKEDQSPGRPVFNPSHPLADERGYVMMPNVNPIEEMANMISADRAYQTNVNLFQTTKAMAMKALEIGR